jgi:hypothetical protein
MISDSTFLFLSVPHNKLGLLNDALKVVASDISKFSRYLPELWVAVAVRPMTGTSPIV